MGVVDYLGEKARKYTAVLAISAMGAVGLGGCATTYQGNPESEEPPVEIAEGGPYDIRFDDITQESFDQIMESVFKVEGGGTYEVVGYANNMQTGAPVNINLDEEHWQDFYDMTEEELEEDLEDGTTELNWHGSMGAVTENKDGETLFLTADHVTPPERMQYQGKILELKDGWMRYQPRDSDQEVAVEEEFANEKRDIAFVAGDKEENIYARFANPDKVDRGDIVGHSGYPFNLERNFTLGRITSERHPDYPEFYISDMQINPGDSGSPVYVFNKGEPLLTGTVNWYRRGSQSINGIARLDGIIDLLEENDIKIQKNDVELLVGGNTDEGE